MFMRKTLVRGKMGGQVIKKQVKNIRRRAEEGVFFSLATDREQRETMKRKKYLVSWEGWVSLLYIISQIHIYTFLPASSKSRTIM